MTDTKSSVHNEQKSVRGQGSVSAANPNHNLFFQFDLTPVIFDLMSVMSAVVMRRWKNNIVTFHIQAGAIL